MMAVGDRLLAEDAVSVLLGIYRRLHTAIAIQRAFLIFPPLDAWVVHCHEGKFVELQYHIGDGQELADLAYQTDSTLQQLVCRGRQPPFSPGPFMNRASVFVM